MKIIFYTVIYEAKVHLTHRLTHGVMESCNKNHVLLQGHISDGTWPSIIISIHVVAALCL